MGEAEANNNDQVFSRAFAICCGDYLFDQVLAHISGTTPTKKFSWIVLSNIDGGGLLKKTVRRIPSTTTSTTLGNHIKGTVGGAPLLLYPSQTGESAKSERHDLGRENMEGIDETERRYVLGPHRRSPVDCCVDLWAFVGGC
jgi:hypothetical protein